MQLGIRVLYNLETGRVLNGALGEIAGDLTNDLRPAIMGQLDLPYGYDSNNFQRAISYHIDVTKDKNTTELKDLIIIDKYIEHVETEEEKLKREKSELENQLLIQADNNLNGGIL